MCGIGATLIEAVHLDRDAIGVEREPRWAKLARRNLAHAAADGATGTGTVIRGDARHLLDLLDPSLHGRAALVLTSPLPAPRSTARSPPVPARAWPSTTTATPTTTTPATWPAPATRSS
jgi:hypothetical protein